MKQELSSCTVEGPRERYQLNWPGKREALLTGNAPIAKTLRPCREDSIHFQSAKNLFIEGDNLDALKLLQETYLNRVKLIFIDPPYNTGREFIYDDDFSESMRNFLVRSNQIDDTGRRLTVNTDANGRFHSDWLSMMYSRLRLARNLLRDDGAIVIAIDDNEVSNLRKMCDEVFGEENFIGCIIWQKVYSPKNSARHFSVDHDYLLVFAKSGSLWSPHLLHAQPRQMLDMRILTTILVVFGNLVILLRVISIAKDVMKLRVHQERPLTPGSDVIGANLMRNSSRWRRIIVFGGAAG